LRKIDSLIKEVLSDLQPDDYQKRNKAVMLWKNIVGEKLAAFTRPVGYDGSILLLSINHPAASMEIGLRKMEILKKLNSVWSEKLFTDLKKV
jgi:hypothetical protein